MKKLFPLFDIKKMTYPRSIVKIIYLNNIIGIRGKNRKVHNFNI